MSSAYICGVKAFDSVCIWGVKTFEPAYMCVQKHVMRLGIIEKQNFDLVLFFLLALAILGLRGVQCTDLLAQ